MGNTEIGMNAIEQQAAEDYEAGFERDLYSWTISDGMYYKMALWDLQIKAKLAEIASAEPKIELTNLGNLAGCTVVATYTGVMDAEHTSIIYKRLRATIPEASSIVVVPGDIKIAVEDE